MAHAMPRSEVIVLIGGSTAEYPGGPCPLAMTVIDFRKGTGERSPEWQSDHSAPLRNKSYSSKGIAPPGTCGLE